MKPDKMVGRQFPVLRLRPKIEQAMLTVPRQATFIHMYDVWLLSAFHTQNHTHTHTGCAPRHTQTNVHMFNSLVNNRQTNLMCSVQSNCITQKHKREWNIAKLKRLKFNALRF